VPHTSPEASPVHRHGAERFAPVLRGEALTVANHETTGANVHVSPLEVQELPTPEAGAHRNVDHLSEPCIPRRRPRLVLSHLAVGVNGAEELLYVLRSEEGFLLLRSRLGYVAYGAFVHELVLFCPREERPDVPVAAPLCGVGRADSLACPSLTRA